MNVEAEGALGVATVGGGPVLFASGPLLGVGWRARIVSLKAWLPPQLLLHRQSRYQILRLLR